MNERSPEPIPVGTPLHLKLRHPKVCSEVHAEMSFAEDEFCDTSLFDDFDPDAAARDSLGDSQLHERASHFSGSLYDRHWYVRA
jgi:hypothetical protein